MTVILNILWFILGGFLVSLAYILGGWSAFMSHHYRHTIRNSVF